MELHSSKHTSCLLLVWGVVMCMCLCLCMRVQGDAMVPQTCSAQTACQAMIGYVPLLNYNLSEIALLFSLTYPSLLGPNDINPSLQNLSKLVWPASKPFSIPQTCGCVGGKRVVTSTNYTVVPGNTLSVISDSLYSKLVTYQEIADLNGVADVDKIFPGQNFTIPIPCACFNESDGSIFLSYQIQSGETLSEIADAHNTSAARLQELNSLNDSSITADSVLFVPLSVCKANFSSSALDKNLTVLDEKYELTANGCVLCSCNNGTLHCINAPSSLGSSCSNTTCPSSNLALGSFTTSQGNGECTVQSCVYKGYTNQSGIIATLETEQDRSCPVALPPESFYKPPTDLVASPLTNPGSTTSTPTPPSPSGTSSSSATPPTSTTANPNSASTFLIEIGFSSWWWCVLAASFLM